MLVALCPCALSRTTVARSATPPGPLRRVALCSTSRCLGVSRMLPCSRDIAAPHSCRAAMLPLKELSSDGLVKGARMKLVSKSAIVTGAGQGIGLGIASRLMRDGANVLLFGRTREKVEAAAEELNRAMEGRTRAVALAGDVVRSQDVARAIEVATREFGLPGILVNNARTA